MCLLLQQATSDAADVFTAYAQAAAPPPRSINRPLSQLPLQQQLQQQRMRSPSPEGSRPLGNVQGFTIHLHIVPRSLQLPVDVELRLIVNGTPWPSVRQVRVVGGLGGTLRGNAAQGSGLRLHHRPSRIITTF